MRIEHIPDTAVSTLSFIGYINSGHSSMDNKEVNAEIIKKIWFVTKNNFGGCEPQHCVNLLEYQPFPILIVCLRFQFFKNLN